MNILLKDDLSANEMQAIRERLRVKRQPAQMISLSDEQKMAMYSNSQLAISTTPSQSNDQEMKEGEEEVISHSLFAKRKNNNNHHIKTSEVLLLPPDCEMKPTLSLRRVGGAVNGQKR